MSHVVGLARFLQQVGAAARPRKARKRLPFRSYRMVRRRQPSGQADDRSLFQRCRTSHSLDSIPAREIRGTSPGRRHQARCSAENYACPRGV